MGAPYSPVRMFRHIRPALLRQYMEKRRLAAEVDWKAVEKGEFDSLSKAIDSVRSAEKAAIESDFVLVSELSTEGASILIRQEADAVRSLWGCHLDEMDTGYERAFLVLLEDRALLEKIADFYEMDRRTDQRWRRRDVGRKLAVSRTKKSLDDFEQALRAIFKPQGRGKLCHVDVYERKEPKRHCFFAYPLDLPKGVLGYDDKNRFTRQLTRTALETIFVYSPEEGFLDISAAGNLQLNTQLAEAFCKHILGVSDVPDPRQRAPYDLRRLKDRAFDFPTDAIDNIDRVELRELRFELPGNGSKRITVSARPDDQRPRAVHDAVAEALDLDRLPLSALDVSQAVLSMTFRTTSGRRKKILTFEVTAPDRCNLKDSGYDAVARKYLLKWGIARV
jgi:hypothetical protein